LYRHELDRTCRRPNTLDFVSLGTVEALLRAIAFQLVRSSSLVSKGSFDKNFQHSLVVRVAILTAKTAIAIVQFRSIVAGQHGVSENYISGRGRRKA
jgi:hypothetical protein